MRDRVIESVFKRAGLVLTVVAGTTVAAAVATPVPATAESFAIVYNGPIKDGGFNESASIGVERAKEEFGIRVRQRVVETGADAEEPLRTYAGAGINNILTIGFSNTEAVKKVAAEFPDSRFTLIDGVVEASNVKSVLFAEDQAGYLAGVAAGLKTTSNRLGFVGGIPIPPVDRYGCGFLQGARSVNPAVTMDWAYIGDTGAAFRDVDGAAAIAGGMLAKGADILFPAAGLAGQGVLTAAADAGALGVGVDINQNGFKPGSVLTSAVKRVDQAVYLSWRDAQNGAWEGGVIRLTVADNGVDWVVDEHNAALVADIEAQVQEKRAGLADGSIAIQPYETVAACTR